MTQMCKVLVVVAFYDSGRWVLMMLLLLLFVVVFVMSQRKKSSGDGFLFGVETRMTRNVESESIIST